MADANIPMAAVEAPEPLVERFCHQYLQLEPTLDYPPADILQQERTQTALYQKLFSENGPCYAPPPRYQLRVLRELVGRIESSIQDWDTHVSSHFAWAG